MKVKIQKPLLESIVTQLIPFTEKRDNTLITSHILIDANNNLTLKATDKEIGIKIQTDAQIIEKGKITINGRKLHNILKALKNDEIEIKNEEDTIIITQQNSIYRLISFNPNEFPEFPNPEDLDKLKIDKEEFIDAIKKTFPVIDTNNPKVELNGELFDIQEKTNFVSTDTRRLAIYYSQGKGNTKQIIVPKRALSEVKRIFKEDMDIFYDDVYLIIKNEQTLLFTKLINGTFPDYKRIIPNNFKYELKIPKEIFTNHLKQVSIVSTEVKITITKNRIIFESISDETIQAKTSFEYESKIEEFTFGVNSKYLLDFLQSIENEEFELCLNDPNIPFMLRDDKFITIVMPLMI